MHKRPPSAPLTKHQQALISNSIFDIGPRTRIIIFMFGLIGIAMAFISSLVSHQDVPLDKVIHFTSYTVLSITFVLALRPAFFIPGLISLVAMSIAIEFLQEHTGRLFEGTDMIANTCGIGLGGMIGMLFRWIFSLIRRDLASQQTREKLVHYKKGDVIIREGDPIHEMLIINSGHVTASRRVNGCEIDLVTSGPGEVLGVLGTIEEKPQYATLRAVEDTAIYRMSMADLIESAGGEQLPISLVLTGLSSKLRLLADEAVDPGRHASDD